MNIDRSSNEALHKSKDEREVSDRLLQDKNRKIDELDARLKQREIEPPGWPELVGEINIATTTAVGTALQELDKLEVLRETIQTARVDVEQVTDEAVDAFGEQMAVHFLYALRQVSAKAVELIREGEALFAA